MCLCFLKDSLQPVLCSSVRAETSCWLPPCKWLNPKPKMLSLDKISDLLPLSWNWGHVNLHTAAAAFGKQTFSEWLCVAKTAFGRIHLEERKPTTDTKHNLRKFFRFYFHIMRLIVYNSLNWAVSSLSSSSLPIYLHRAKFHFQKKIKN